MGLPWTDDVTDLTSTNLNRAIHTADNTRGVRTALCKFTSAASPALTNLDGFLSIARNGAGDYTLAFKTAFTGAPVCAAVADADQPTSVMCISTTTNVRVLVHRWDAGTQTFNTSESSGTVRFIHLTVTGIQ